MDFLYAIFFGAGATGFAYTKIGRRVGYGNTKNVTTTLAVIFVFSTLIFFTIIAFIL